VLVVSWGLTLFLSTLYGDLIGNWDYSAGSLTSDAAAISDSDSDDDDSLSVSSVALISTLSMVMEGVLKVVALGLFRCSLVASQAQSRRGGKASAVFVAAAVVAVCIFYPLACVLSERRCRYVRRLFPQFFVSDLIRGIPLAAAVASTWYILLSTLGKRAILNDAEIVELTQVRVQS
ncbi:unnamed protein product, partial [Symbiodinium pilosum]